MATNTTNYGWTKPSYEDAADIEVINGTIDNIDAQVKTVETAIPTTLAELSGDSTHRTVTDTEKATWNAKADVADIPTVPITAIQKNGIGVTPVSGTVNIIVPTTAADVSALPDTTKHATALSLTINSSTFVMTGQLKDQNGDNLGTAQTIDLPLESFVVNGSYNNTTKKVVLTLQNGNIIEFSVADLVAGLQTELSASNKLNPAYINYDSTHRAVSDTEKSTWNGKQSALSTAQLAAVNSDIDSAKVAQYDSTTKLEAEDRAALVELVDGGAKNLLKITGTSQTINGVTFTVESTGEIIISGTASNNTFYNITGNFELDAGSYIVNILDGSTTNTYYIGLRDLDGENYYLYSNNRTLTLARKTQFSWARIAIYSGYGFDNVVFKPMVCTAKDYAISPKFVPYRPSYQELYDMVKALQTNQ